MTGDGECHGPIMASALVNGTASPDFTAVNNENVNPGRQSIRSPSGVKAMEPGRKQSNAPSDTNPR